jgi:hypothetical protein
MPPDKARRTDEDLFTGVSKRTVLGHSWRMSPRWFFRKCTSLLGAIGWSVLWLGFRGSLVGRSRKAPAEVSYWLTRTSRSSYGSSWVTQRPGRCSLTQVVLPLCSNRAATRVNLLNDVEKPQRLNTCICGSFASSGNLQETIILLSHGRGRWFEPSIAHSRKAPLCSINLSV